MMQKLPASEILTHSQPSWRNSAVAVCLISDGSSWRNSACLSGQTSATALESGPATSAPKRSLRQECRNRLCYPDRVKRRYHGLVQNWSKRLQNFLKQTPASELLEMSFSELAQVTHCTSRHLSRIFYELVGISFRDQRAKLRLARAQELLATTNSKVGDVALESGYKSLSLFNLMFARRFGISPGRWRKQHDKHSGKAAAPLLNSGRGRDTGYEASQ